MISTAHQRGQILIGLIVAMGILSILTVTIATLVLSAYDLLNYTSTRTTAKYIATEQIEIIRNLPFTQVGTVGGIPPGILQQEQTSHRNGLPYTIRTSVIYVDDPFDNVAPDDLLPTDYKRVRVDVSWGGLAASRSATVTLISDIAPRGIETSTGGTLSILVFDADGNPVRDANVHIVAASVNPPVDLTLQTADNGRVILPGAPACNNCYQITVSKDGYNSDQTYGTAQVANPTKPNQTIIVQQLTQISFSIDQTSTLTINSTNDRASGFTPLPNQAFNLRGEKIIGTTTLDQPVYKYDEDLVTDGNGNLAIPDMEWDVYILTPTNPSFDTAGTNSLLPIVLLPNTAQTFRYANVTNSANSLLAIFTDAGRNPIASVTAELREDGNPIATISSGLATDPDFGQSFFGNLLAKTYQLIATASGYATYSASVAVSGNDSEEIILNP